MRSVVASCCVCLLAASLAARADEWNKKTYVTNKVPLEVPNIVLQPGTYVVKLADSAADRNIVQIWNKDETRLYTTVLAIPDYRLQPTGKTVLQFEERAAGSPPALKAWFYPGDLYGQQFVYPKVRAIAIARRTNQPVLSMPNETKPQSAALKQAPVKAVTPQGKEVEMAQVVKPKPPAQPEGKAAPAAKPATQVAQARPKHLPKTASEEPLIALLGVLSLGAALGVRRLARG